VEERLRLAGEMTLGPLAKEATRFLPEGFGERLSGAVARRNFLAHEFWYERLHLMMSAEGMGRLIDELGGDVDLFSVLDRDLAAILSQHRRSLGISDEQVEAHIAEFSVAPPEPLPNRRLPSREEAIDGAWLVPSGTQGSHLVLRSRDGDLWQLCEVGLGWSFCRGPHSSWPVFEPLAKALPATVRARPKVERPWSYVLEFSTGVEVVVAPWAEGEGPPFVFRVRRARSPR
jgi:hypothetical protein